MSHLTQRVCLSAVVIFFTEKRWFKGEGESKKTWSGITKEKQNMAVHHLT